MEEFVVLRRVGLILLHCERNTGASVRPGRRKARAGPRRAGPFEVSEGLASAWGGAAAR